MKWILVALAITFLVSSTESACAVSSGFTSTPGGPYRETCRYIEVDGQTLYASCKTDKGDWKDANLGNINECVGSILNQNGVLGCVRKGSYSDSCKDIKVVDSTLYATCKTKVGSWASSTKLEDAAYCNTRIVNYDGKLICRQFSD